eukprot:Rhum_TRINITY_DN14705_c11_g2::Rhum_TRINITY_DN14705_c11_g2_i1::g.112259::m.112259
MLHRPTVPAAPLPDALVVVAAEATVSGPHRRRPGGSSLTVPGRPTLPAHRASGPIRVAALALPLRFAVAAPVAPEPLASRAGTPVHRRRRPLQAAAAADGANGTGPAEPAQGVELRQRSEVRASAVVAGVAAVVGAGRRRARRARRTRGTTTAARLPRQGRQGVREQLRRAAAAAGTAGAAAHGAAHDARPARAGVDAPRRAADEVLGVRGGRLEEDGALQRLAEQLPLLQLQQLLLALVEEAARHLDRRPLRVHHARQRVGVVRHLLFPRAADAAADAAAGAAQLRELLRAHTRLALGRQLLLEQRHAALQVALLVERRAQLLRHVVQLPFALRQLPLVTLRQGRRVSVGGSGGGTRRRRSSSSSSSPHLTTASRRRSRTIPGKPHSSSTTRSTTRKHPLRRESDGPTIPPLRVHPSPATTRPRLSRRPRRRRHLHRPHPHRRRRHRRRRRRRLRRRRLPHRWHPSLPRTTPAPPDREEDVRPSRARRRLVRVRRVCVETPLSLKRAQAPFSSTPCPTVSNEVQIL